MCRYLIKVGNNNNVKPGNILGAIANEAVGNARGAIF
jgi:ATP-dependent RNA helicase DeaD